MTLVFPDNAIPTVLGGGLLTVRIAEGVGKSPDGYTVYVSNHSDSRLEVGLDFAQSDNLSQLDERGKQGSQKTATCVLNPKETLLASKLTPYRKNRDYGSALAARALQPSSARRLTARFASLARQSRGRPRGSRSRWTRGS